MLKRRCIICGEDISDRPSHHFLCYDCWKSENGSYSGGRNYSNYDDDEDDYRLNRNSGYNDTYYERYRGDSEYDMGPDWDYDEFPPENL